MGFGFGDFGLKGFGRRLRLRASVSVSSIPRLGLIAQTLGFGVKKSKAQAPTHVVSFLLTSYNRFWGGSEYEHVAHVWKVRRFRSSVLVEGACLAGFRVWGLGFRRFRYTGLACLCQQIIETTVVARGTC